MYDNNDGTFLGFDFSTQQVKAVVIDHDFKTLAEESVQFDCDLPEYRTHGGVNENGHNRVTVPTIMWVKALDILMEKLRISGVDFSQVLALSGAAQQHGSVYWRTGAREMLRNLKSEKFLHDQLAHAFSVLNSPIWMDTSTAKECKILEESVGGPQVLADITGSRAYERFTASQIMKISKEKSEAFGHTENISLVSSFACSLFLGDFAPMDYSDAGGTNLFDINKKKWSKECLEATAPFLAEKLLDPVQGSSVVGKISLYMQERYGFDPDCDVIVFTGDNPATLAGLRMRNGDIGISLGTSDTLFVCFQNPEPQLVGHVWNSPIDKDSFMGLLCYKNGSLTRERIRDAAAEGSWDLFDQLLDSTPRGNFGNIGMYFDTVEITPKNVKGDFRFNKSGERVARFASAEAEVRACIEGQVLAKRIHCETQGFSVDKDATRILVTGGGSVNKNICQVIADVFNAPVFILNCSNSAALGSCYRARHGHLGGEEALGFYDSLRGLEEVFHLLCRPHNDALSVYKPLLERYRSLEQRILQSQVTD